MIKNIVIALFAGIILGGSAKADSPTSQVMTRRDWYRCALLIGLNAGSVGWDCNQRIQLAKSGTEEAMK